MSFPTVSSSSSLELSCRQFTIFEILVATKNFDQSLVVGRGGFGKVYKGTIINGAGVLDVAIKRLESTSNQGALEFWDEVKMLSKLKHCYLVSLIGYCNDKQEMILVYEYMPHGTLDDHLHKHKRIAILTWLQRLKICLGAARGLDYLHTGTGIKHGVIHRDVKTSNILLHNSWTAKVSDFGLSKLFPTNQSSTGVSTFVKGTFGYLDPHYYATGKLTEKSDVYAFGVVLLEVLSGKQALDTSITKHWIPASLRNNGVWQDGLKILLKKEFAHLAHQCLHSRPMERPTMAEVVVCLTFVLTLQEKAKDTLQPVGRTMFGRKVPMFLTANNGEHSSSAGDKYLKSLDTYLYTVGGENRILCRIDFDTLNVATENFSKANLISGHRWGNNNMYKGRLQSGRKIAIVGIPHTYVIEDMKNEVSILIKLEHENLFQVLGYCIDEKELFLVDEFAPYATLETLLFGPECPLLDWNKRCEILLGVARVLLYLHKHAGIQITHCNLTTDKILLDESLDPKLCDFGLARFLTSNKMDYINAGHGAMGYMAPEFYNSGLMTCKVDVFSFGVVIFETISGIKSMTCNQRIDRFVASEGYAARNWFEG